jgi:hypothetical protein
MPPAIAPIVESLAPVWTIASLRPIAAIATRHVWRLLIPANRAAAVADCGVVPREVDASAGGAAQRLASDDVVARLAGFSRLTGLTRLSHLTRLAFDPWCRRRWCGWFRLDRGRALEARCSVRRGVAAWCGIRLRADAGVVRSALGVLAIRVIAGIRTGLVGRTSSTAATRGASTFGHSIVG